MTGGARWSRITDRQRTGFKGPGAADWLRSLAFPVPQAANSWMPCAAGEGFLARLGSSEFFLDAPAAVIAKLDAARANALPGVYPVLRADAAFLLEGAGAPDILAQVCNVNFAALELNGSPIVMTLMIGVGVLVLPQQSGVGRHYRVWCDPSFGEYLEEQVRAIIAADIIEGGSSSTTGAQS